MATKKGIDVSYWNAGLTAAHYKKMKSAGVNFVIARAGGYVGTMADSRFNGHYESAKAAGLEFGVYYYSSAVTVAQAVKEAQHCVKLCKGKKLDMPIFMDVEDNETQGKLSKAKLTEIIKAFVNEVKKSGYKCGVYASLYWLTSKIGDLSGIDVWVAQYNSTCGYTKKKALWQYSSTGKFAGVPGTFDLNYCYIDYSNKNATAAKPEAKKAYTGVYPTLPSRGWFRSGDSGSQVKNLQKFLNWSAGSKLNVDGIIGPATISAVKTYQKKYDLKQDGFFGKDCLAKAKTIKK